MNYTFITTKENTVITLKRTRTLETVLSVICFSISLFFLPMGLLLFLSPGYDIHYPFFWTGFGLLFLMGGVMVSTQIKIPEYLEFDNNNGIFVIRGKKNAASEEAVIPYHDIEGFHVRSHVSDNYTYSAVEMEKKDGAFWNIFSSKSKDKAESFCNRLTKSVNLSAPARTTGQTQNPGLINIAAAGDSTTFTWANRYSLKGYLLLVLVLSSMGMLIYGSRPYTGGPVQYGIAVGFIGLITAIAVFSILNNIGRRHAIGITKDTFTYRKIGGILKRGEFSLPVGEIDAILFNFALSSLETAIYILKKDEKELFQSIKRGIYQKSDIFAALQLMKTIRKIDVGDLSLAGKIHLEEQLQKSVCELSGRKGL